MGEAEVHAIFRWLLTRQPFEVYEYMASLKEQDSELWGAVRGMLIRVWQR